MRILLVEDDEKLATAIAQGLRERHIEVHRAQNAGAGRRQLAAAVYDVIVLDIILPDSSGFDLCMNARRSGLSVPILMLTARDAVEDRVRGLESGADDYLTKPFAFAELHARVRALARRQPALRDAVVRVADLEVDLEAHEARRRGKRIPLTTKEFALLECFVRNQNRLLDRATIMAWVWDENHDPFTNVIDVLIGRLRRKVDANFEPKLIHTLRGAGYRFGLAPNADADSAPVARSRSA